MNKYLKWSLILAAVYAVLAVATGFLVGIEGTLSEFVVNNVGSCFSSGEISSLCYFAVYSGGGAIWKIAFYGMILAALASAITGLIAVYQSLISYARWWHVITVYGALNALLVFGTAFASLTA